MRRFGRLALEKTGRESRRGLRVMRGWTGRVILGLLWMQAMVSPVGVGGLEIGAHTDPLRDGLVLWP
jgi:hypothetical protein